MNRGFTLLEVLAATMIFAMVMTMLIGSSSETVHRARLSASQLEAGQLAEREIAKLEATLGAQLRPPEDYEAEVEDFLIRVASRPALDDFGGGGLGGGDTGSAGAGLAALLALQAPGIDQFLLRYDVHVEWLDGAVGRRIERTTYAFDWEGARAALPDLFAAGAAVGDDLGADDVPDEVREAAGGALPQLPSGPR